MADVPVADPGSGHGPPPVLAPMLAGGNGMPADPEGWVFEPKWDGVRAIVTVHEGAVTVANRRGGDVTAAYPELAGLGRHGPLAGRSAVLDGEVVAFDEAGRPSFQRLQRRMHVRNPGSRLMADVPVAFVAFDLLWIDGELVIGEPHSGRRGRLEGLGLSGPAWHTSPLLPGAPGDELLEACRQVGLEGYMAKRTDRPYLPGHRSPWWSKVKCVRRREFVVGGWSPGKGGRGGSIGSLALGCYESEGGDARLLYVGQAGSGLSDDLIRILREAFNRIERASSPFDDPVDAGLRFVDPLVVAEVSYTQVTESGTLRQPAIKGLRTDVDPRAVVADEEILSRRR